MTGKSRCWRYGKDACRQPAVNSVRIGARAIHWCNDPKHDPKHYLTQEGK